MLGKWLSFITIRDFKEFKNLKCDLLLLTRTTGPKQVQCQCDLYASEKEKGYKNTASYHLLLSYKVFANQKDIGTLVKTIVHHAKHLIML